MKISLAYPFLMIMLLCNSCHTRQVAMTRVDSTAKHDSIVIDRSKTVTVNHLDTVIKVPEYTIHAPAMPDKQPFTFQDSDMSVSVAYDSSGHVYAQATEKAKSIIAKLDQTITTQKNIVAQVHNQVTLQKKIKAVKSSGAPFLVWIIVGVFALLGIGLWIYKK